MDVGQDVVGNFDFLVSSKRESGKGSDISNAD